MKSIRAEAAERGVSLWRVRQDRGETKAPSPHPACDRPGRPVVRAGVRLPSDLHARLRVAAVERDVSINWLVVKAVEEFLENLIPPDEWRLTRWEED